LCIHETLDAIGGAIEGACKLCNFIAAFDLNARLQIAGTQRIHARLQALEAAGDAPRDWVGS